MARRRSKRVSIVSSRGHMRTRMSVRKRGRRKR